MFCTVITIGTKKKRMGSNSVDKSNVRKHLLEPSQ